MVNESNQQTRFRIEDHIVVVPCSCWPKRTMLITLPHNRRVSQYLSLKPVPLAFLVGLLMGLFGALVLMGEDHIHGNNDRMKSRPRPLPSIVGQSNSGKQQQAPLPMHSVIKHIDDIAMRKTSHGTSKQQLVEPFALHPHLAGISIATLYDGEDIERHSHATMYEFFYVLEGSLLIRDDNNDNASLLWKECPVGCFYQGSPGEDQEFRVKSGAGPVRMLVYQLTLATTNDATNG
jgi:hypothetical protein